MIRRLNDYEFSSQENKSFTKKCLELNMEEYEEAGVRPHYRIQLRKNKHTIITLMTVRDCDIAIVWFRSFADLLKKMGSVESSGW